MDDGGGPGPGPGRSPRAGRACGPRRSWASCCSRCGAGASSPRASWPSRRSPSPCCPVSIYVLSYVPWMRQGHAPADLWPHAGGHLAVPRRPERDASLLQQVVHLAVALPAHLVLLQAGPTSVVRGIVAIGNPALWWVSVPVVRLGARHRAAARDPRRLFAGAGFFALYLPWGISPRTLNYSHYLFEAIPYACLSLGLILDRAWDGAGPPVGARVRRARGRAAASSSCPSSSRCPSRWTGTTTTSATACGPGRGSRPGCEGL